MSELIPVDVRQYDHERLLFSDSPQWQSMDTAPKDGTWFLGYVPYCIGWLDVSGVGPLRFCWWSTSDGEFRDAGNYTIGSQIRAWSPFLTPPAEARVVMIDSETGAIMQDFEQDPDL